MLKKITMPAAGQTTDTLIIAKWHKQAGDHVKRGDVLLDVETDKAALEVESYAQGILLKILVDEGESAVVGDVIAYVGEEKDLAELERTSSGKTETPAEPDDYKPIMPEAEKAVNNNSVQESINGVLKASPAAKKAARDLNLDINEIFAASGKSILKKNDILEGAKAPSGIEKTNDRVNHQSYDVIPLTGMRRTIAARMLQSTSSIPSFTAEIEVDMEACVNLRKELNSYGKGVKISYNDILAKCVAMAGLQYPLVNASYQEDGIRVFKAFNIGLAVSLDSGLVVPVVADVGNKSLSDISKENAENIAKVREGKIEPALFENGTFTVSNLGMYPVSRFTAIINPPQSCILAIGSMRTLPVWSEGAWTGRQMMTITATFDHRVIDGAYGAEFLKKLKEILEHPALMLL